MRIGQDEITAAISQLQSQPTTEHFTKFLAITGSQIEQNLELQFITAKAKVVLGIADSTTWNSLLNYFKNQRQIYPAICCAEALLLTEEKTEVVSRHAQLLAIYNDGKEKELALIREIFIENPPEITVSIIMPTYNRHQYIGRAIESVLDQTFKDFELIIVNDGGSRECEAVIESFQSDKIRYLYVEHGGLSHALNQGILASRSKYIAYLDDDDRYFSDHLQTLVSALESSSYPFIYTDGYRVVKQYEDGTWTQKSKDAALSYDFNPGRFAEGNYIPILYIAHQRNCLEQIGLFETGLPNVMDWDLWAKAAMLYDFKHLNKVTCEYEYRIGPDSLTGRQLDHLFFGRVLQKHHQYLAKQVWSGLTKKADCGLLCYAEIESKIIRYSDDKCQLAEWLLPYAFTEGKWHRAYRLITRMTRSQPKKALFTIRHLIPKISVLAQIFSLWIIFLNLPEGVVKHFARKGLNTFRLEHRKGKR